MRADAPGLHQLDTEALLRVLRDADEQAMAAVHAAAPELARAIDAVVAGWPAGGRLIYIGAGTSGRIGALDASECGPTFGIGSDRVFAIIAGGPRALSQAVEAAEDFEADGVAAIDAAAVAANDVVVGLSASGTTPYTCAALEAARSRRARTVALTCGADSRLVRAADIPVVLSVGGEVIEGSTRMKAGTAQKLSCNAISTASFIRLGRVWDRHMVSVRTSSDKLKRRATGILQHLGASSDEAAAASLLAAAGDDLPTALVMGLGDVSREIAAASLEDAHGDVHRALAIAGQRE